MRWDAPAAGGRSWLSGRVLPTGAPGLMVSCAEIGAGRHLLWTKLGPLEAGHPPESGYRRVRGGGWHLLGTKLGPLEAGHPPESGYPYLWLVVGWSNGCKSGGIADVSVSISFGNPRRPAAILL